LIEFALPGYREFRIARFDQLILSRVLAVELYRYRCCGCSAARKKRLIKVQPTATAQTPQFAYVMAGSQPQSGEHAMN